MTTYLQSGVNIKAGDEFVKRIKKKVQSTYTPAVLNSIGCFGGFFDARFKGIKNPVLVSSTDGVGTKLKVAFMMDKHDTIGADLVNHCVNDIAVCGAKPIFFLDYIAMGKFNLRIAEEIISGMVRACREHSCALIGGETAEMPGFYRENEYDIAGTIVGIAEKEKIFDGKLIHAGDVLIGIQSNGLHTNGYSLARQVLFERFECEQYIDELGMQLGEALLAVHRSYYKIIQCLIDIPSVHGFAHITGGGIVSNIERLLPKKLHTKIYWDQWQKPPLFQLIQKYGNVSEAEMRRTFNLGIGLVIISSKKEAEKIINILEQKNEKPIIIGEIIKQ